MPLGHSKVGHGRPGISLLWSVIGLAVLRVADGRIGKTLILRQYNFPAHLSSHFTLIGKSQFTVWARRDRSRSGATYFLLGG